MPGHRIIRWLAGVLLLACSPVLQAGGIASVNLCLDQMLLQFAPRAQIASLTWFADNPLMSPMADRARGLPTNHGLVEEIVPLAPDLVLAGEYGAREAVDLLRQLGYRVEQMPLPYQLADIETHLLRMGELLGQPPALAAYRSQWQARQQRLGQWQAGLSEADKPRALMLGPNFVAPGQGTLEHELLALAGFRNWAAGEQGFAGVALEQLALDPPDLLIVDRVADRHFSLAHEVLRHPALGQLASRLASLPGPLTVCPAPNINGLLDALLALHPRGKEML